MFKSLNSLQRFQSGSDLWLMFFEPKRRLFKQINWQTGFLLQNLKKKPSVSQPVLLDTHHIFPNDSLICLPLNKEIWLSDTYNCWQRMNTPSLRVFVPLDCNGDRLNQYWTQSEGFYNLSYYKENKR